MNFMNIGLNQFFSLLLIRYPSIYLKQSDIVIKIHSQEQVVTTLVLLLRRSNLYLSQMLHEFHFSTCNHFVPKLWLVQVVKCFCEEPPRLGIPLTTIVRISQTKTQVNQCMTINVRLCIKAWKYKQSVKKSCGEDAFIDESMFYHTIHQLNIFTGT